MGMATKLSTCCAQTAYYLTFDKYYKLTGREKQD